MIKWSLRISLLFTTVVSCLESYQVSRRIDFTAVPEGSFIGITLGLLIFLVLFSLVIALLSIWAFLNDSLVEKIQGLLCKKDWFWGVTVILTLAAVEAFQDLLFLQAGLKEDYYPAIFLENQDLLLWTLFVSGQTLIFWLMIGWREGRIKISSPSRTSLWLLFGLLISGVIYLSGRQGSLPPNAPLPFLHVFLTTLFVIAIWLTLRWISKKFPGTAKIYRNDLLALAILWAGAFLLWSRVPLQPNYFISEPRPPNYQFTPTSDAIYYDIQAQRLLIGDEFEPDVQHSLYNYFLSGLHVIGGDHYLDIYRLQIAVLAFLPFLIYKLAGLLNSKFAGWMAAILVLVREYNALQLGDSITVSNVQELMTEPLATLGVVLFLYLTILWIRDRPGKWGRAILIGTVIAATALIRVELISLAFVFAFLVVIQYWRDYQKWLIPVLLMLTGLMVVLAPWLVRNYYKTGQVTIDKGVVLTRTVQTYTNQTAPNGSSETEQETLGENLSRLVKRTRDRSFSSLEQSLIYLPSNHFPLGGIDNFIKVVPEKGKVFLFQDGVFSDQYLTSYIKSLPYWEVRWDGSLAPRSILPQLFVVLMITNGIVSSYRNFRWVGLLPLLAMLAHILVYSIVRFSGGRYIQVVDWISLLYFCFGMTALVGKGLKVEFRDLPSGADFDSPSDIPQNKWKGAGWAVLVFFVVLTMPVVEASIPNRYTLALLTSRLAEPGDEYGSENITPGQLDRECQQGKALYPGYFIAGERFGDDRAGRMPDAGRAQMVFYLVGTRNIWVSLPAQEPVSSFAHGSEIVVCGQLTRNTPRDLENKLHPYFLADRLFFLNH